MSHVKISKIEQQTAFTMVDKAVLFNPLLSLQEKGLFAILLSMRDDGTCRLSDIHQFSTDGVKATETAKKGLKAAGHLKVINTAGDWSAEIYRIPLEVPVTGVELRKKPINPLIAVLKKHGLTDAAINEIIAETSVNNATENNNINLTAANVATVKEDLPPSTGAGVSVTATETRSEIIKRYVAEMQTDKVFLEDTAKFYGLELSEMSGLLNEFLNLSPSVTVPNIESYTKFTQHFYYWIPKRTKAKQHAVNKAKKAKNGEVLPTHDEIKTELDRALKMLYAAKEGEFTRFKDNVLNVITWGEKAEKLKIVLNEDVTKKTSYYLGLKNASDYKLQSVFNTIVQHNSTKEGS